MMKKLLFSAFLASAAGSVFAAAAIEQVIVRQQWPWSTDVKVEYKLSGVTTPVDIDVRAFNGAAELALPQAAMTGRRYCIAEDGVGQIFIDPVKAFGTNKVALANFRVKLTVADSSESSREALYKIVNLESPYDVEDVTRGELLNGKYGSVETDFGRIGKDFTTALDDVLIWTGVTNNPAYKTTHMVLRKIPAKGKSFTYSGSVAVSFAHDFYLGVFEVTQTQYKKMRNPAAGSFNETNQQYAPMRPADNLYWANDLRGTVDGILWPSGEHTTLDANTWFKLLQDRTGLVFDLPTDAMWEFSCRAGTTSDLYTGGSLKIGQEYNLAHLQLIMRASGVNHPETTSTAAADCDLSTGPNIVGSYAPNAWGLYDMLGNVNELVLDRRDGKVPPGGEDPRGPTEQKDNHRKMRGGSYCGLPCKCTDLNWYNQGYNGRSNGFRVCLYPDETVK